MTPTKPRWNSMRLGSGRAAAKFNTNSTPRARVDARHGSFATRKARFTRDSLAVVRG